jgi:predicted esterase/catechol 2,3-dioxygenase-like lactoylglutathione lyase family enzyme
MPQPKLCLPHSPRSPKNAFGKPPLLIMLHGMGGNDKEFLALAETLDDRFLTVSVRAPFAPTPARCNWFTVESISGVLVNNTAQVEYSRQLMVQFVREAVVAYGVNPAQVYLFGFDQGAVIALNLLLTEPELAAGAVVICGQVTQEVRSLTAAPERLKGRFLLVQQGRADDAYPAAQAVAGREFLAHLPLFLDYRDYASGRYITQDILADARRWLTARLDAQRGAGLPDPPPYQARMGHIHLKVRNLDRALAFYVRFFGFKLVERVGNAYAFLATGDSHHELALQNVGQEAQAPMAQGVGLYHLAFEVPDQISFARAYQTLAAAGVPVTTVDHLVSWSMYFTDPDGNGLEIYWDTRTQRGKADFWQGRDLPLKPETVLAVVGSGDK